MKTLTIYAAVGAAGALGAMARLLVATICAQLLTTSFPIGTFVINITGSLFLGWFAGHGVGEIGRFRRHEARHRDRIRRRLHDVFNVHVRNQRLDQQRRAASGGD